MTDREHPSGFDAQLARVLAAHDQRRSPTCLDAEVLAAWADDTLDSVARMDCERHLAGCAHCRAILAAADFAVEPEAQAGLTGTIPTRELARVVRFPWRSVAWASAPLALAATVLLAVWVSRDTDRPLLPTPQKETRMAGGVEADRAQVPPAVRDESLADRAKQAPAVASRPSARPVTRDERGGAAPGKVSPGVVGGVSGGVVGGVVGAVPVAPSPPFESRQVASAEAPSIAPARDTSPLRDTAATNVVAPPPAPPPPLSSPQAAARQSAPGTRAEAKMARARAAATQWSSPTGRVIWSIAAGGRLFRSSSGAVPEVVTATGADLSAGAALSDELAWVVGKLGVVWRTTDGQSWQRVPFPTSDDLVDVHLPGGADTAIITAADGRQWTTRDGGRTWAP